MKPKKQIDFLVEEFFNTGKIDLNKEEVGITFDQLNLLTEAKYSYLKDSSFTFPNPHGQPVTYTITRVEDAGGDNPTLHVKDQRQNTKQYTLRTVVERGEDIALTPKHLKNFLPQEEIVVDAPAPPEEEINVDLPQEDTNIEDIIDDILHKADTLDELEDAIEWAQAGGIDINDEEIEPLFWRSFKKREEEIEKALSLDQEVRGYDPTLLSDDAKRVLQGATWKTMEEKELEEFLTTLDEEIDTLKKEMSERIHKFIEDKGYKGKTNRGQQKNIDVFKDEIYAEFISPIVASREAIAEQLEELEKINDPNYLFAEVFVDNPCFIHALTQRRDNKDEEKTFQELRKRILEKYNKDIQINTLDSRFKFFKTLKAGWLSKGYTPQYIDSRINALIEVLNKPNFNAPQGELYKEKCNIKEFDELREPGKFIFRAEQSVKNELPITKSKTIEEMTQMALYRVNAIFNIIQNDDNNILRMKHAIQDKYKKLLQLIKSYGLGEKIEEWNVKYEKASDDEKRYMVRLVEDSLREVVYGLGQMESQMKDIIENENLADDKTLKVLNNVYNRVNDAETIIDNLQALRTNNSRKYELSFTTCINADTNIPYFIHSSHEDIDVNGDGSTIVANSKIITGNNNIWLRERLDDIVSGTTTISQIIDIIYEQINPEGVLKFDIKSTQDVMVTSSTGVNLTIPEGSYIEVKKSFKHSYHLSEFFGVYKNYKKANFPPRYNTEKYKKIYNQIIDGVIKKINKDGDKGIIDRLRGDNGTFGIFFEDYIFYRIEDLVIEWTNIGQRKTESRMTISIKPSDTAIKYQWNRETGNCNCEPLLRGQPCDDTTPIEESLDRYISEALGF